MDSRQRVTTVLAGELPDRIPLDDTFWTTTEERWWREGMPANVSARDFFAVNEIVRIDGDYTMQFPERLVREDTTLREYWDSDGALRQDLHVEDGWTSHWMDFTIKSMEDWQTHRHRMAFNPTRIRAGTLETYRRARQEGRFICYMGHATFHPTWMRIGMENLLMEMLTDPELIHALFAAHAQLIIDIFEGMWAMGLAFDGVFLPDDLGYNAGPLISPKLYRNLVFPYHKQLCDHFAERGLKTILHSDGDISLLIPHFIDAGFAGLHPLEVKAGLDLRELYADYGDRLIFFGNIDARALAGSHEEIEAEIVDKMTFAREHGRYIYHSDHSVPHSVSFENYGYAIDLIKQLNGSVRV
ncbi:MAG: hypothetical protein HC802_15200 [Caldilineaceae bacterium]|nr:hypothetical protein [Caldilineaceae bacterium]